MVTTPSAKTARKIADEHEALRRTLAELLATEESAGLSRLLSELAGELEEHFAQEEGNDGLAAAVPTATPHQVTKLERLFEEHRAFLSTVADLRERSSAIARHVREVQADVKKLCDDLHAHEHHETDLLLDAINLDIGAGD